MKGEKISNLEIENYSLQKERDLLKLKNEKYLLMLKSNGIDIGNKNEEEKK